MNKKRYIKAVSVIEYSLIVAVAVAALLGMSIYVQRAICGRWRQAADGFGYGRQYDAPQIKIFSPGGTSGIGGGTGGGGIGGGGTGGGGIGGGGTGVIAVPSPVPVHSGGGWSNLAAKGGSGARVDPGLQSAVDLLKNSSSGSYVYDLIKDKKIEVQFADLKDYKADARFEVRKYQWATPLIIKNRILVDNSFKNAPAALLAALIAHEATHADYYYYPDFWIATTLSRHPELTRDQIHTGNSVNQEYDAFCNGIAVGKELGGGYPGWLEVYEQGEEYMRVEIKAIYAGNGENLPDY